MIQGGIKFKWFRKGKSHLFYTQKPKLYHQIGPDPSYCGII